MQDKVICAALGVAFALAPAAASAQVRTIDVGGIPREYLLHEPSAGTSSPDALVIVLHGGGGTPAGMAAHTGFSRLADREGFIVAYPAGLNGGWLDGRRGRERADDIDFLRRLADTLRRRHRIPPERVFITGISNGAMMSYRLACEAPGEIGGIAPVAGAMFEALASRCGVGDAVAVVALNGTADRIIPHEGRGGMLSVSGSIGFWADRAGCGTPATPVTIDSVGDGTRVTYVGYPDCERPIGLYTIHGGGHTWPGGPAVRSTRLGHTTREIDATEVIWRFFDRTASAPRGR